MEMFRPQISQIRADFLQVLPREICGPTEIRFTGYPRPFADQVYSVRVGRLLSVALQ